MTTVAGKNNKLVFFSYPYNILTEDINIAEDVNIIKTNVIQDGIKINYLSTEN
jgi:hypothetical protein